MFQKLNKNDDEHLIEEYAQLQTHSAFIKIYEKYYHRVLGVCMKYLQDEPTSRDMTNEVFIDLMESIPKYYPFKTSFIVWLYTVVKNKCFKKIKKENRIVFSDDVNDIIEKNPENFVENEGPLTLNNENSEEQQLILLNEAIEQLKQNQQICIKAFYLEEMTYSEIQEKYEFTFKEVKNYIQNGRRKLKILLNNKL